MRPILLATGLVLVLISQFSLLPAQETPESLRKEARELGTKQNEMQKEVRRIQAEVHRLEGRAFALDNKEKLDESISAIKAERPENERKVLLYSRTRGFRHKSIPYGIHVLTELGIKTGAYRVDATEDPAVFTPENLAQYDGIIMLNTTGGDAIPDGEARKAFESFLEGNKGLIGIHAATDCHAGWNNYREAMGGLFDGHPWGAGHLVTLYNEEPDHPVSECVPQSYQMKDEIYQYKDDEHFTRDKLRILLSLDLSGEKMKANHMKRKDHDYAVSWIRPYKGSRVFYSNLGHNDFTYYNPVALQHFLNGIQYALGDLAADDRSSAAIGNGTPKPPPPGF